MSTYEDVEGSVIFPDLPATTEELQRLLDGGAVSWSGTGDAQTTVPVQGEPPKG